MKRIIIQILLHDDKIATMINPKGYRQDDLGDQFELLGIFENLKDIQKKKIKTLMDRTISSN